jgi:branched-chain amino acid transport system ATP-binding protein
VVAPDHSAAPGLAVRGVSVRYAGVLAVNDVSLTAQRGEVLALIGPNGAGKTTLFDAISGLRRPNSGQVMLGDRDVTQASAVRRARLGLRRTFQRHQVFGGLSVEDNVLCGGEWRGGGGGVVGDLLALRGRRRREADRRTSLYPVLDLCGLAGVHTVPANELPIGQARMLELARALVAAPTVLLLDEPTSGLGDDDIERLTCVIEKLRADGTCAVVLVEHDIAFVMQHADRVVALVRGEVVASGTPAEIQRHSTVQAAYLG